MESPKASNHTFVVCAYGDNPYLGETLDSLLGQTVESRVIVATSTPSEYIEAECLSRGLPLQVNPVSLGAASDWNFAYGLAKTPLVTLAHQDDLYESDFLEITLHARSEARFAVAVSFTDYYEIRDGELALNSPLLALKRRMNVPFRSLRRPAPRAVKLGVLALGDPICCPACTYDKRLAGERPFDESYINSADYAAYVRLAREDAGFLYVPAPLVGHRIYEGSATTRNISDGSRSREDREIMLSILPAPAAKMVSRAYEFAQRSNETTPAAASTPSSAAEVLNFSWSEIAKTAWAWASTKAFYPGARLVRRPISVRGKKGFAYGTRFTTGRNCRIEVFGDGRISLGDDVHIGDNVHITASSSVSIGNGCLFASKVYVSDTSHGMYSENGSSPDKPPNDRPLTADPVAIGENVWLGENVVVLPGVTIGDGCVVGANSTVTKSLPAACVAVGSPAVPIKRYDFEVGGWVRSGAGFAG